MAKNRDKRKAYYDFYNLAKCTNDYGAEDLEKFMYFSKTPLVFVPENEKILIRRVLNPKREFYRVEGPGRHYLKPGLEEYIRVPNPANSIVIDPHQVSEEDKKELKLFCQSLNKNIDFETMTISNSEYFITPKISI